MLGLAILLIFNFVGVILHDYSHVPLPGNVLGLLLLLLALAVKVVRLEQVEAAAGFLLKHMMVLFAPVIVGALAMTQLLAANWLPLVCTITLSTIVTLLATAAVASVFTSESAAPAPTDAEKKSEVAP